MASTPDPVAESGFATLPSLRVGVKVFVYKDGEKRRAEVLSIQDRADQLRFYVHYEDFNKRLDEWVAGDRLDLSKEVEWPLPDKPDKKKVPATGAAGKAAKKAQKSNKRPRTAFEQDLGDSVAQPKSVDWSRTEGSEAADDSIAYVQTEVLDDSVQPDDEQIELEDVQDAAAVAKAATPLVYSREDEIEKLRVGGSMTQNQAEISRVRNLDKIQMGKYEMEPWYYSPYPLELTDESMIYICEFCLSYFGELRQFGRHRVKCELIHPPGNEIYRDDEISFFEIDGRRQRTWCRNLCLLSKLFLDHKTLYYDVDPFWFYCMTIKDEHGWHLIGYFSKEKESADGFNVACILTLPQYQRTGYGKLLIAFSYELSRRENKLGSPEKPLSDLGLLSYRAYWEETIVDILMDDVRSEVTVDELSFLAAMTTNDVLHTLQNLNMLRYFKGQYVVVLTNAVIERRQRHQEKDRLRKQKRIDPKKLMWKPPVIAASARTWAW